MKISISVPSGREAIGQPPPERSRNSAGISIYKRDKDKKGRIIMIKYRLALIAASMMAIAIMGCAGLPMASPGNHNDFYLMTSDADFAKLGLDRNEVKPWEDGRRAPKNLAYFEWWYFDGLLDDGTVIVAWFGENWPYGSGTGNVNIEITSPGQDTKKILKTFTEPGSFSKERADIKIGPHSFSGNLSTYRIVIDAADTGGLGADITLTRQIGPHRPATGHIAAKDKYFAWLVAVPNGEIAGTMTIDGVSRKIHGSGYHDHNWGNVSPADLMDNWWWGRAVVGDRTIIVAELRVKKSIGGGNVPFYFVATPSGVEVSAYNRAEVTVEEGPMVVHPDPKHTNRIASSLTFTAKNGMEAIFPISEHLLTSADILSGQSWGVKKLLAIAGIKPWYSRFVSPVTLKVPGSEPIKGEGTIEFFEFK